MSLPNTFPFTLALSICHWGLPHRVDRVSGWWNRFSCSLVVLSYFTPFYSLLQKKMLPHFFFFFRACSCIHLCSRVRPRGCIAVCLVVLYSRIPATQPLRVLQLPFLAVSSSPLSHRLLQIPIGDGSALEFIPHHPAELWPSNSQPLWPRQMNNKTRALRLISGKKKSEKRMETARCLTFIREPVPVQWGKRPANYVLIYLFFLFCRGNSNRTSA